MSKIALEASAWDTPVVAINKPDLRFTVVPELTGLLVASEDISAWQNVLTKVLSSNFYPAKQNENVDCYSEFKLNNANFRKEYLSSSFSSCSRAKIAIYLSYLYRYLLANTLTQQLAWTSPILPWQNSLSNLICFPASEKAS